MQFFQYITVTLYCNCLVGHKSYNKNSTEKAKRLFKNNVEYYHHKSMGEMEVFGVEQELQELRAVLVTMSEQFRMMYDLIVIKR